LNKKAIVITLLSLTAVVLTSCLIVFTFFETEGATASGSMITTDTDTSEDSTANIVDGSKRELTYEYNPETNGNGSTNQKTIDTGAPMEEESFIPATEIDLDPSSITVFINKEYSVSKTYKPDDLVVANIYFNLTYNDERTMLRQEAATAIERLFRAAKVNGYELSGVSGYRSYARQFKIFRNNIIYQGKEHTLKYSAVPGTSEHQTGLAMDVSCASENFDLDTDFANTPEGIWLAENSYRYGFIIRYPQGKSDITGYAYEPWHIRYVGKALATYLYEQDLTLEEYYQYTPSAGFDFEALYADLINYTPSVSPLPMDSEGIILGENGEIIEIELGDEVEQLPESDVDPSTGEIPGGTVIDDSEQLPEGDSDTDTSTEEGSDTEEGLPGSETEPSDGSDPENSADDIGNDPSGGGTGSEDAPEDGPTDPSTEDGTSGDGGQSPSDPEGADLTPVPTAAPTP